MLVVYNAVGEERMPRVQDDEVYEVLKEEITHFRVAPGARLVETELSARFNTSRTPIRSALQRLTQDGLVVAANGARLARPFDQREFEDMYRVRIAIERLSVEQACERGWEGALDQLRQSWDEPLRREGAGPEEALEAELRVHMGIARLSQNELLITTLDRINDRIQVLRKMDFLDADRVARTSDDHREILELIAARDAQRAADLMQAHIEGALANISRLVSGALSQASLERSGAA